MLKNYVFSILIVIGSMLGINLITTILSYFNLISPKVISIMSFVLLLISMFVSSFMLGTKSKQKGYLEGLKLGGIIILIFILLVLLLDKFMIKSLIYYAIIMLVSVLGSMLGINRRKN